MAWYRLRITWTYSNNSGANTAETALNNTMVAQGFAERVVRNGTSLELTIEPLTSEQAITLRNATTPNWATGTRTAGKASIVLRDEWSA